MHILHNSRALRAREEAREAMLEDILISTPYESLDEIIEEADAGLCGFSDDEAWAETNQNGTGQWKIVKVPEPECYVLTNVSEDTDGTVCAGTATVFDTEFDAIEKALAEAKYEAQEGGTPYVLSLSRDGRTETYTVSKIPG